jgi:hypothetical protein
MGAGSLQLSSVRGLTGRPSWSRGHIRADSIHEPRCLFLESENFATPGAECRVDPFSVGACHGSRQMLQNNLGRQGPTLASASGVRNKQLCGAIFGAGLAGAARQGMSVV